MKSKPNQKDVVWSYGITTIPDRFNTTLPRSIHSLQRTGFGKPRLFIDGVDITDKWRRFNLPITNRWPQVGAVKNWILALSELYYRNPMADLYALFQDDILCINNLKKYIECFEFPHKGYLNLYTNVENQYTAILGDNPDGSKQIGIGWFNPLLKGKGALGLVFNKLSITTILSSDFMLKKVLNLDRGHKNIDGAVVQIMRDNGFSEWCHSPSLIQHTGTISTLNNLPGQYAPVFQGEDYNAMNFFQLEEPRIK